MWQGLVQLLVTPHQTRKWDIPLVLLSHSNNPRAPHTTKNKNIKPLLDRYVGQVTKMSRGNKKIKAIKIPATNKEFLIWIGSLIHLALFKEILGTNYKVLVCTGTGMQLTVCYFIHFFFKIFYWTNRQKLLPHGQFQLVLPSNFSQSLCFLPTFSWGSL